MGMAINFMVLPKYTVPGLVPFRGDGTRPAVLVQLWVWVFLTYMYFCKMHVYALSTSLLARLFVPH